MSPAKARKSARSAKAPKGKAKARAKPAAKAAARKAAAKPAKAAKAKPAAKAGKPAAAKPDTSHCAASDPFGDPCQNLPRRPSRYCVIHSYLER